eukprot:gene21245-28161_t
MFPTDRIRNFCIIAHVDHGKSTLADRLMELTGAIDKGGQTQYLDKLQVERDRGITVKAQTVSLVYKYKGEDYLLNLIDTPGHVDFSYEVSRSLAACQGALLVVDAGQGIQAQTVANYHLASGQGLSLIPVINKIDLPAAQPSVVAQQMGDIFGVDPEAALLTSAKKGTGLSTVLPAVIERIPSPKGSKDAPMRALIFDTFHDEYRGVVCLVQVVDGCLKKGDKIVAASTGLSYEVLDAGILTPEPHATGKLMTGQVGYIVPGIKSLKAARVGDTLYNAKEGPLSEVLPGFKPAKSNVYAGLYAISGEDFEELCGAMDKLLLNDASVVVKKETSEALGPGFRCGFLGMLHMEVFMQRLEQEYGASVITTTPTVPYIVELADGEVIQLERASDFPVEKKLISIMEPTVNASIIVPDTYLGKVIELCQARRGEMLDHSVLAGGSVTSMENMQPGEEGGGRTLVRYILPLAELAGDFYNDLKSCSQGYASFDYEEGEYREADLQRLDILAHRKVIDALARMVHKDDAMRIGRELCKKMSDLLDKQQFEAAANGKVIARETIKARRKDVTAKCYGGDVTRKRKLLDKQKEGKRKMKRLGSLDVPQDLV